MLTVIVIAKNEGERIGVCLDSVNFADEVILIDNGSNDQTIKIANSRNAKIIPCYTKFGKEDFSELRNLGLKNASGDWVLYIDADERVLKSLKDEIQKLIGSQDVVGAFAIPRRNVILGKEQKYSAFWPDYVIRLFKKSHIKNWQGRIHEQPIFIGSLGKLENPLFHLTHRDVDSIVLKSLDWANIDAKLRLEAGHPPMTPLRFFRILITEIWHQGIIRGGFFNGTIGMIDSLLQVFSLFISYVKLWQLQQYKSRSQVYKEIDRKLVESDFISK